MFQNMSSTYFFNIYCLSAVANTWHKEVNTHFLLGIRDVILHLVVFDLY